MSRALDAACTPPPDDLLLGVWESGRLLSPAERAAMLVRVLPATGTEPRDQVDASIGELQRRLLEVRRSLFGSDMVGLAECGTCGRTLELSVSVEEVLREASARPGPFKERVGEYDLVFSPPTVADLQAAGDLADPNEARRLLIRRSVARASRDGEETTPEQLPEDVCVALGRRIADLDPLADVVLAAVCSECGADCSIPFDIGCYLWSEIEASALRLLDDIHVLASSYGWSEREILALPGDRRGMYVELAAC